MFSACKHRGSNRDNYRSSFLKRRSFFRPRLEILEDRCLPAINTWMAGGMFGNWNNAANWSQMRVPNNTDIATFDNSSAAACVIDFTMSGNTASGINIAFNYPGAIVANAHRHTGLSNSSGFNTTLWAVWSTSVAWVDVHNGAFV